MDVTQTYRLDSQQDGFTVVELLIALLVFLVGMLGIMTMCLTSIGGAATAQNMTSATMYAQAKLEELINEPDLGALVSGNEDVVPGAGQFSRTWIVSPGETSGSRWVEVQVTWKDQIGGHQVMFQTLTRGGGV